METQFDVYEEYPELRDIRPRRSSSGSGRGGKKMSNSNKLAMLLLLTAAAVILAAVILPKLFPPVNVVYGKDGSVVEVKSGEEEKYLAEGYYASAADIAPVTMYANDGTVITTCRGDVEKLEKRGYFEDKSKAYVNMYDENGNTVYVPAVMADSYKAKGWYDSLGDVISVLYKEDGSKLAVPKSEAEKYLKQGWSDRILKVAKKMIGPGGEEKMVFNKDVDAYLDRGWTVVKRAIDPDQPMVALTFDDGPGKYTGTLLDCLEKYNSAATFFVVGKNVEKYADTVKRADKLGCEIANHTWDHVDLSSIAPEEAKAALEKTSDAVKAVIGKPTAMFRPSFGAYNADVLSVAAMPAILWSIDTRDWKTLNADSTYDKVMNDIYDGAIILMHDIHQPTVEAALRLIPELTEKGYQLVTVSELLEYKCGGAEKGRVYCDIKDIK